MKKSELKQLIKEIILESGPPLDDWLYLIHHIHAEDVENEEELHHCFMIDHLGNLYKVEHIIGKDDNIYHCLTGLKADQRIYRSDSEAKEDNEKVPCANRQLK
jgi:hypothetical protein